MNKQLSQTYSMFQPLTKKLSYSGVPPVQELRYFLTELYQSTFGGSVDFCFTINGEFHTLNLQYVKSESRTKWRLYTNNVLNAHILWEAESRDAGRVHSQLLAIAAEKKSAMPQDKPAVTVVEATLTTTELMANLQKFLAEVQHVEDVPQKIEAVEEIKTQLGDLVDLNIGRYALNSLLLNEFGILSYPAFLFCSLREYAAANEHRTPLSFILLMLTMSHNGTSYLLSRAMLVDVLQGIKKMLRKTDSIGQYNLSNTFAIVLPETDTSGAKYLVDRLQELLRRYELEHGLVPGALQLRTSCASAGVFCNSIGTILGSAEQSFAKVCELGQSLGVFNELFPGQSPVSKDIDLNIVQDLVEKLVVKEYGIFSFPIMVAFLENELNRAKRNRKPFHLLLLRLVNNGLPRIEEAMSCLVHRINSLQSNNYLLAHYNQNTIAVFAPKIFASALKSFGTEIINSIGDKPLNSDETINSYKVAMQIREVDFQNGNIKFLSIKPYDPDKSDNVQSGIY